MRTPAVEALRDVDTRDGWRRLIAVGALAALAISSDAARSQVETEAADGPAPLDGPAAGPNNDRKGLRSDGAAQWVSGQADQRRGPSEKRGSAAVQFADRQYFLHPLAYMFRRGPHPYHEDDVTRGTHYFDRLQIEDRRAGLGGGLSFAVEDGDGSPFRYCVAEDDCADVLIGIREQTGQMYLFADRELEQNWRTRQGYFPLADMPARRAEMSVEDRGTGLKIYREVVAHPAKDVPDCTGYPEMDVHRYTCLFLGERLPRDAGETPPALREALPGLVQPAENYDLVFAEEFDDSLVDRSDGCANGMRSLDPAAWTYDENPCNNRGSRGVLCFNVVAGHFYMARNARCGPTLRSIGKLAFKYGYIELKYKVNLDAHSAYGNIAVVSFPGTERGSLRPHLPRFGMSLASYEDVGRYFGGEIDLVEYIPAALRGSDVQHQYINESATPAAAGLPGARADKRIVICKSAEPWEVRVDPGCSRSSEVTITKGLEWTPRGYRTFFKVGGVHDDFVVRPVSKIRIQTKEGESWAIVSDPDPYFEELVPGDASSVLEQVAIAHLPADIGMASWGWHRYWEDYVRTKFKLDYIRIFQPRNRYADMDPVYQ